MKRCRHFVIEFLRTARSERGQSLAEMCVGSALLVLILLGAVEVGQVAYSSIEVANAAKAGVQYGASSVNNFCNAQDAAGIQSAAQAAAYDLPGLTATPSTTCICSNGDSSSCQPTDCSTSHNETILSVQTQYSLTPIIRIPSLPFIQTPSIPNTFTLKGQAIQKCGY